MLRVVRALVHAAALAAALLLDRVSQTLPALRLWPWGLLGLLLALVASIEIVGWYAAAHPVVFGDVDWYATALRALLGNTPLYDPATLGPHPMQGPSFWNQAPSLAPFTLLIWISPWLWPAMTVGLFLVGLAVIWPRLGMGGSLMLLPLLLMWEPLQAALISANVNAAVFGLLALALRFPRIAGWMIGLAAALKLVPILGVAWLIGRRDWRAAAIAISLLVILTSVTVAWEGMRVIPDFLTQRANETDPRSATRFGLAALGLSPMVGYGIALVLALLAVRFASFTLAIAAMVISVPAPHAHYWSWALVPLLGIGLPWLLSGPLSPRTSPRRRLSWRHTSSWCRCSSSTGEGEARMRSLLFLQRFQREAGWALSLVSLRAWRRYQTYGGRPYPQ
jgi:hypothetical protein